MSEVRAGVPGVNLDGMSWLAEVRDSAVLRVADDVYFKPEASQAKIIPPPFVMRDHHSVFVPVELIILGIPVVLYVRSRRRKKSGV